MSRGRCLGDGWEAALEPSEAAAAEYSPDISPILLAAHLNQFEIIQLLQVNLSPPHTRGRMGKGGVGLRAGA